MYLFSQDLIYKAFICTNHKYILLTTKMQCLDLEQTFSINSEWGQTKMNSS